MIRNIQREKDALASSKHEDKAPPTTTSSPRLWPGLKNPRIVRVSRAFGGKDRHSKVSTIRGLRDRRVRLSVPTAIQLYDLQDRLGLNQPSKVVDWLLNATQHEIDKLPPLQIPPQGFIQSHDQSMHLNLDVIPPKINKNQREDTKESLREDLSNEIDLQSRPSCNTSHSSVSGFLGNTLVPCASYYQWEAANTFLSTQLGINRSSQLIEAPIMSINPAASQSQIVFYPSGIMPSMFSSNVAAPLMDYNAKQFGQLQMANSISQTPQSNLEISSLQLRSPSARPPNFQ